MLRRANYFGLVCLSAMVLGGCRATVPIGDLLDDPFVYDGRRVKVEGDVVGAVGALGKGAYLVDDGTGSLLIVREEGRGGLPRSGSRVKVSGWFRSVATIGPITAAVMLENSRNPARQD